MDEKYLREEKERMDLSRSRAMDDKGTVDLQAADMRRSGYTEEQIQKRLRELESMRPYPPADDIGPGAEYLRALAKNPNENSMQQILRVVGNLGGLLPLVQEAAIRIPVPPGTAPTLAIAYEKAKDLPTITPEGTKASSGRYGPAVAGVINQLNRHLEGESNPEKMKWLRGEAKKGDWSTLGELFLNAKPDERGLKREGWWSQSMERLEEGKDGVRLFQDGAERAGFSPKYSGLAHLKGLVEGDPYSTASMFGLVADLLTPSPKVGPAIEGTSVAIRGLPRASGTKPKKLAEAVKTFFQEVRGKDVDAAAPHVARAKKALEEGEDFLMELPPQIKVNLKTLVPAEALDALVKMATKPKIGPSEWAPASKGSPGLVDSVPLDLSDEAKLLEEVTGVTFNPAKTAEDLYVAEVGGVGNRARVSEAQDALAQLIGESYRIVYRNTLGDDRLKNVAQGVWVTRNEAKQIEKVVDPEMAPLVKAMTRKAEDVDGVETVKLTGDEMKDLHALSVKYGVVPSIDGDRMSRAAMRGFRNDVVTKLAGRGALVTNYGRRTPAYKAMGRAFLNLTPDKFQRLARIGNDTADRWMRAFVDLDRQRMSLPMRTELDRIYRKLTHNGTDAALDLRKLVAEEKKTGAVNPVRVMRTLMKDNIDVVPEDQMEALIAFRKVSLDDAVIADDTLTAKGGVKPSWFLKNYRDKHIGLIGPMLTPAKREALERSKDPLEIYRIIKEWSDKLDSKIQHQVKVLLETLYTPITSVAKAAAKIKGGSKIGRAGSTSTELYGINTARANAINGVTSDEARRMYKNFFLNDDVIPDNAGWAVNESLTSGKLGLDEFMKDAKGIVGSIPLGKQLGLRSYLDWWWQYIMNMRAEKYTADGMRDLVAREFALPTNSPVYEALNDMVRNPDGPRMLNAVAGNGTAADSAAIKYLQRMGADEFILKAGRQLPETMSDLIEFTKTGTGMVPAVAGEYRRMRDLGLMSSREMTGLRLYDNLRAVSREMMTLGYWFLAKPAYFLSNALAVPEQLYMTTGSRGLSGSGRMFTNPKIVSELVKRNATGWKPRSSNLALKTKSGVWGVDELEEAIKQFGVDRTFSRTENGRALMNDLLRENPKVISRAMQAGGSIQEGLRTVNDSIEYAFRVAIFIDGLQRGEDAATAARVARDALYDYSSLTPAERKLARSVFTFYTFIRKNMGAFWSALAKDPNRVTRSLRFYNAQPSLNQMDRERFSDLEEQDLGRLVLGNFEDRSGRKGLYMSSPQSVFDALLLSYDLLNAPLGTGQAIGDKLGRSVGKPDVYRTQGASLNELAGLLAPFTLPEPGYFLKMYAREQDSDAPGSTIRYNSRWNNRIPFWMMEGAMGHQMRNVFPDIRWWSVDEPGQSARYRDGFELPGFWALEMPESGLPHEQERIKDQIATWQAVKDVLGGGQPYRSAQKLADLFVGNGWMEEGMVQTRQGSGNLMDILSSVQRVPKFSDEIEIKRLEEYNRAKLSSEKEMFDRVRP